MGAPLAPVIADIFMAHLETTLMDQLKQSGVCEWHRYVDDTFVLLEPTTNVADVLTILNNFHASIKFTYELEKDHSLPFLDVRVIRPQNSQQFETTIYRKPTFTGLMTNWHSFVPLQYKKSSIVSMVQRALAICSTYTTLAAEFQEIRRIGVANGYPISFIDTRIGIGLNRQLAKNDSNTTILPLIGCEKKRMYVEIPFIGRPTDLLKKRFSQLSSKVRPDLDIRFYTKPPPAVQTFFQTKDPIVKHMQSDVVYSISCIDCNQTYIGKTERQSIRRLREHGAPKQSFDSRPTEQASSDEDDTATPDSTSTSLRRSSRIRNKNHITPTNTSNTTNDKKREKETEIVSSLAQHTKDTGHHIDWTGFRVAWRDDNPYRLLIKESLLIQAFKPELNRTTHSVPLIVFPDGLPRDMLPDPNG
ncbi:unnamed protein product [Adineta ricciae]|nr:unnamed protein product [Adineta ricciae]